MIYTHILNGGARGVRSPADSLQIAEAGCVLYRKPDETA